MLKQFKRALSFVWTIYRAGSLLHAAWEFIRDHFDGF